MQPKEWLINNPLKLPVTIRLLRDGETFQADFPALEHCRAYGTTLDEVVLNLAKEIQKALETKEQGVAQ